MKKNLRKIFTIIVAVMMLSCVLSLAAFAHGNVNGQENGKGHGYDAGVGAGPGNGKGYGHNNGNGDISDDSSDEQGSDEQDSDEQDPIIIFVDSQSEIVNTDEAATVIDSEEVPLTAAPQAPAADEAIEVSAEVPLDASPDTGDESSVTLLWILLLVSLSGLTAVALPGKRTEE